MQLRAQGAFSKAESHQQSREPSAKQRAISKAESHQQSREPSAKHKEPSAIQENILTSLYGIKNCDSVKKARRWLDQHSQGYDFIDLREDGITASRISDWLNHCDASKLVNRRSTSWKNLTQGQRDNITQLLEQIAETAGSSSKQPKQLNIQLSEILEANPLLIKRPVIATDKQTLLIGFNESQYKAALTA